MPSSPPTTMPTFTREEVAAHRTAEDFWTIIGRSVYHLDAEFVLEQHPGGQYIMEAAGKDGTVLFEDSHHPESALEVLEQFKIGKLKT